LFRRFGADGSGERKLPQEGFVYDKTNYRNPMTQIAETPRDEQAKVESWRLHVLMEAGYPLPLAEKIAHSNADLHHAVDLIRQGCAPEIAAEILL
jgi:hypothetical protein